MRYGMGVSVTLQFTHMVRIANRAPHCGKYETLPHHRRRIKAAFQRRTMSNRKGISFSLLAALWVLQSLISIACSAQSVGAVISYHKTDHGIEGKTAQGSFAVLVYSEHVVRVQVSRKDRPDNFSYSLVDNSTPKYTDFSVEEIGENRVALKTASLAVEIERTPLFRVIFKDAQGKILNEDTPGTGLGTTFTGEKVTVYKTLQQGERFVGLGEELGNLDRRGSVVTLWNTDDYKYDDPRIPMYVSIPFFIGLHHDEMYGIYFDNSYRSVFNFGASNKRFSSYSFDGGDRDEFFIHDVSVGKILEHYTGLTGRMPLPPQWSLGYQQSRCSYSPEATVMFIARTLREKQIPADGIVLDADYLKDYEPFRIDPERFPDMRALAAKLHDMNFELTASVNPGIRIDDTYAAYKSGLEQGVFLKYADGQPYIADIYPNTNRFPDFTDPEARAWWIDNMKVYQDVGINGYWNDMNEPAIDAQAMPDNVVFNFDGRKGTTAEAHNYYGMLMARSSFESFQKYGGNKRPFVLSRSGFAGIQRYAAVWSGDNQAKDEHILLGVLLNNQMGLAGVPFTGPDLGGYIGDGNKELYKRWLEVGVFSPYLRNHREQFGAANEPWAYGEEAEAISKTYIGFRYRMMPYLYSEFRESSETGMPISRCLCIDNPFDEKVFEQKSQYEFLFGDALLVNPMTSKEKSKSTYLPHGDWYDLFSDEKIQGGRETSAEYPGYRIPIFVKASSILPLQSKVLSTKDKPSDTLDVHVFFGTNAHSFVYYEDDGGTLDYQHGAYYRRTINFDPVAKKIEFGRPEGNRASQFKRIELVLHGFSTQNRFRENGRPAAVQESEARILDPLADLEPLYFDKEQFRLLREKETTLPQKTLTVDNTAEIVISWD
jgi:alpha-glucosidase